MANDSLISRAIEARPNDHSFYVNLGAVLCAMGRPDEAEDAYHRAAEISDDFAEAHYNLANLYKDRGDFREADIRYKQGPGIRSRPCNGDLQPCQYTSDIRSFR